MNKNSKMLFLISALLILLVGLGTLSAESLDNNQISAEDSIINVDSNNQEQSDLIKMEKQTFTNNVKEASSASSYDELKSYVNDATDAETEIILEEKTYDINEPIVWGTSETAKILTINGNGATIDGANNYQFLTVNEGYTLNLNNLVIQNTIAEKGSAILNYGTLNINNVTFKDNVAQKAGNRAAGAAIYSEGTASVKDSTFTNNRITDGVNGDDGAAIHAKGPLYVYNSKFDSNIGEYTDTSSSSNGANGGAIAVIDSIYDFIVDNSTFTNNKGRHGGALIIYDEQGRNQGIKKITNSTFTGNQAIYGGAIEVYNDLIIEDSRFEDNFVYGIGSSNFNPRGGAICVNNLTQTGILNLTIRNTSFERNTAPQTAISGSTLVGYGGAIDNSASETIIENCTFIDNSANKGGAYHSQDNNRNRVMHATINDTRFISNVAMDGAAIFDQHNGNVGTDSLTIDYSVFENNIPTSTAYYGISLNYDDLTITNTEITGVRPIKVATSQRSSKYGYNVTVNGLHNVTGINVNNPVVSPTNYEELVLVSKEINNEYTGVESVYINLVGTEYIETEPIVFDDMPCTVTINGTSKTIDANGKQFLTIGDGKSVILRNMTIANAKAERGAAIINYGTLNTQNNLIFDNNEALYYGGAIYSTGNLSVSTTNFTNNKVTTISDATVNDYGGAAICSLGKLTVQRSNFVENVAAHDVSPDGDGGCGGAINILNTTQDVSITASNFTKNDAGHGGAISIDNNGNENTKKVTIDNNKFDENTALYGAAINTYQQVNITNSKFENNDAKELGDLVYALNDVTIKGSTINTDNLEKLIGGNGNIIANDNIVNDETLPERLIKTSVTVTPVTHLNLDEDNLISATLIDATNVPVVGKEVNILINGEVVGTGETDENGVVSYIYKPTEGTSATIQFTFTPDDYYIASESEEIEVDLVSRLDTVIEYVIVNDVEGKVVVDIRVYEKESEDLIVNARVDLTGDVEATDVRTNKLYQNTELEAGEHTITATYNGLDYYYKPCTTDITLTVIEDPSTLIAELNETIENQASQISEMNDTINDLNNSLAEANDRIDEILEMIKKDTVIVVDEIPETVYGNYVTISGKLTDSNGQELPEESLSITINNQSYDIITDENGIFTYDYRAKTIGINNVTVSYDGNEKYNPHNTKSEFETIKCDVIVTFDEIEEVVRGENVTITGKFTTIEGKPISNSNVRVFINGVKYLARTDKTGTYTLSTKTTVVGINNVTVAYAGNDNYNSYETNGTFNVVKQDVIVTFNPIEDVAYGSNVTITGAFTDVNGKAITNSNVKIIINGKKYYARTDSSGAFTFTAKTVDMGINEVSIGYSGNDNYNSYETTTTFNVGKQDVIVTYNPIDPVASGENVTITGKFTNVEGKAIISSNVKIIINGKKYYARTDNNGVYVFSMPITTTGINNVTVGYSGNDKYNSYEINTTFVCL